MTDVAPPSPGTAVEALPVVERLVVARGLTVADLFRTLGLSPVAASPPDAPVRVWRAERPSNAVPALELREARLGRVIVASLRATLPPGPQLLSRFGAPSSLRPPRPGAGGPTWTTWRQEWGSLSLGRDPGDETLVHVAVDTTGSP